MFELRLILEKERKLRAEAEEERRLVKVYGWKRGIRYVDIIIYYSFGILLGGTAAIYNFGVDPGYVMLATLPLWILAALVRGEIVENIKKQAKNEEQKGDL